MLQRWANLALDFKAGNGNNNSDHLEPTDASNIITDNIVVTNFI